MFFHKLMAIFVCGMLAASVYAAPKNEPDRFGPGVPLPPVLADMIDANQDGAVNDAEAARATKQLPPLAKSKTPLGKFVLQSLDADENGRLDEQEAAAGVARARQHARGVASEVRFIFEKLDKNGDERISVVEFRGLVGSLGVLDEFVKGDLAKFFNAMDLNRDGLISPTESQRGADYLEAQIAREKQRRAMQAKLRDPLFHQAAGLVQSLDRNRDRQVSAREAARNKDVQAAFAFVDADANGQLSTDECYQHLRSLAAAQRNLQNEP